MTDRSHSHVAHVKANHFLSATNKQYARTQNEGLFWQKKKKRVTVNMVIENAISISTGQSNFI